MLDREKVKKLLFPSRTVYFWIAFILWTLLFLSVFRFLFLLRHQHLAYGLPANELFNSFLRGIRFDFVIVGYIILPFLFVSFLPYIGFQYSRLSRRLSQIILYIIFAIVFLLSLIDIEYFGEFGDHLGVWFYSYFDSFDIIWYTVTESFPVFWYVLGWILLTGLFVIIAGRFNRLFTTNSRGNVINNFIYFVILTALIALGMRGGASLAPLDWGEAYHSNYYFANELSLNGTFTLSKNLYEYYDDVSRHNPSRYRFYDFDKALNTVQNAVVAPNDSLIEPEKSLKRLSSYSKVDANKQNVVIIMLESWSAGFIGALGGAPSASPFFDSLAEKGILFENFYASGLRTNRGLLSVLCSFPSLPGRTVMKLYGSAHPFMSIADILKEHGYESYFIYGGDLGFDNMGGFFRMKGFENFVGIDDFKNADVLNKWGVPDHIVFEKANEIFSESGPEPFLGVILTLSNHKPFVLPDNSMKPFPPDVQYYDHLNAFYYSDWALGHFFDLAQSEDYFANTIFVLVSDHGQVMRHPEEILKNFRIASLIYCPGREDIKPRRIKTIAGQVDLLPTILGLLALPAVHESWGRDILNPANAGKNFAFINKGDTYGWIQDSLLFWEKVNARTQVYLNENYSVELLDEKLIADEYLEQMQLKGRAMLQLEVDMVHRR
jgi:phosphoglycerol transferase MdoB-like AlkP superfamily enzyme